ncbi:MAG: protein kinase, partial [Candidatus Krumholzibacteria bacterium]|nr:protein kinase [Candidatus Krumholzibacteria bacterium]
LNHPNITTIYEFLEDEDTRLICMEYVEGKTIRDMVETGTVSVRKAIDIIMQAAEALEAAHNKGILHRDIKSANVMLTGDGQVKVMDFGLATVAGATTITKSNTTMGTVAYMSPEQTRGEEVDERSDIWSLGVCLYEMLTGELPFTGEYDTAVSFAILNMEPVPVSRLRPGIALEFDDIIEKAMAKDLDDRYTSVARMMADLKSVREGLDPESEASSSPGKTQPSIAVLPFVDMSQEKDQEYFCFGMAEEIINNLVQVDGLDVVSRTSSFAFKGAQQDIRKIGQKLGVTSVLEGSVRKSGDQLRITAHLINVADGYDMWSEQYDRETKDVFVIEEEIGRSIVDALKIKLSDKGKRALERSATTDVEAYDFYLRGRKLFYQTKRSRIRDARNMFSDAIKKDPNYALAYAGMADSYSYLYWYFDRKEENLEKAMAASQKALELDPELAEAHAARGLAVSLNKQYK